MVMGHSIAEVTACFLFVLINPLVVLNREESIYKVTFSQ